mmetsp:Transcript_24636/g.38294  ORF Transcript_24636/g.38294 Transcript_24636/m.38294 type:complete len:93 (+) Transcript_24636:817-1095(+)
MPVLPQVSEAPLENEEGSRPSIIGILSDERSHHLSEKDMEQAEKKIKRMTHRAKKKAFIIYPENKLKDYWDLMITIVLLVSCILTPVDIAFK